MTASFLPNSKITPQGQRLVLNNKKKEVTQRVKRNTNFNGNIQNSLFQSNN